MARRTRRRGLALNVRITSPSQFRRVFKGRGMKVVIAVSDDTCPHCVNYKPTWKSISETPGRNIPMISMPSSVYSETELAKKKPINSVPTVVLVDETGKVHEVDGRNVSKMTSLVTESNTVTSNIPTNIPIAPLPTALQVPGLTGVESDSIPVSSINVANMNRSPNVSKPVANVSKTKNRSPNVSNKIVAVLPGVTTELNPLTPLPSLPVQTGGNPWSAFMMAAKQAAPAALLLGAYSTLPKRSSGLPNPRRTRRR